MRLCPVGTDLRFPCELTAEAEVFPRLGDHLWCNLGDVLSDLWSPAGDLHFVVGPCTECVVTIPAVLELGRQVLFEEHQPLLADNRTCTLQEGVQCSV